MTVADVASGRRWVRLRPAPIDLYLLKLTVRPAALALVIAMAALLTERLLRLFDMVAEQGAALGPVLVMTFSLTPHYLGLALPAAFCIGMLSTLGELGRNNELDVLEGAGWSLRRIGAAFVVSAVILALLNLALYGYVQPYARYAYRAAKHAVVAAGWSGKVEQGVFFDVGDGMVVSAAEVDPSGLLLKDVFVLAPTEDGEAVTTAKRGIVTRDMVSGTVRLRMEDGVSMTPFGVMRFEQLMLSREFSLNADPFRPRNRTRELTLWELATSDGDESSDPEARAEFHARLVRSVSLVPLAMAAVPLGVAGKRKAGWPRFAVAVILIAAWHQGLLYLQELAALGRVDPVVSLWGACAAFCVLGGWLYASAESQGGRSPVRRLLRLFERPVGDGAQPVASVRPS